MASSAIGLNGPIGVQEGRNKIINGEFALWQRGNSKSFSATGGTTFDYTSDRWFYYSATAAGTTSAAVEIRKESFEFGTEPDSVPSPENYLKLILGTTGEGLTTDQQSQAYLEQRIENVNSFEGQSATISFWAKSSETSRVIQISAHQFFGTGVTASHVAGLTFGVTPTWTKYSGRITIPSVAGKVLGESATSNHLALRFNLQSGSSAGYMYDTINWPAGATEDFALTQVQLEENSLPTNFEKLDEESEIQRAGRFFEIVPVHPIAYGTANNTASTHRLIKKRTSDYEVKFSEAGDFIARNQNRGLDAIDKRDDSLTAYVTDHNGADGNVIPKFTSDFGSGAGSNDLDGYIRLAVDDEIHIGSTGGN